MAAEEDKKKAKDNVDEVASPTFSEFTENITINRMASTSSSTEDNEEQDSQLPQAATGPRFGASFERTPSVVNVTNVDENNNDNNGDTEDKKDELAGQHPQEIDISQISQFLLNPRSGSGLGHNDNDDSSPGVRFQHTPASSMTSPIDASPSHPTSSAAMAMSRTPQMTSLQSRESFFHEITLDDGGDSNNNMNNNNNNNNRNDGGRNSLAPILDAVSEEKLDGNETENETDHDDDEEDEVMDDRLMQLNVSRISGVSGARRATLNISDMPTRKQQQQQQQQNKQKRQSRKNKNIPLMFGMMSAGANDANTKGDESPLQIIKDDENDDGKNENDKGIGSISKASGASGKHSRKHSRRRSSLVEKGSLRDLQSSGRHSRRSSRQSNDMIGRSRDDQDNLGNDNFADDSDYGYNDDMSENSSSGDMGSGVVFVRRKTHTFSNDDLALIRQPSNVSIASSDNMSMDDTFSGYPHHYRQKSSIGASRIFADIDLKDIYSSIPDTYEERERLAREARERENANPQIKRRHSLKASFRLVSSPSRSGNEDNDENDKSSNKFTSPKAKDDEIDMPSQTSVDSAPKVSGTQEREKEKEKEEENVVVPSSNVDEDNRQRPGAGDVNVALAPSSDNDERRRSSDQMRSLMPANVASRLLSAHTDSIAEGNEPETSSGDTSPTRHGSIGKRGSRELEEAPIKRGENDNDNDNDDDFVGLARDTLAAPTSHVKARESTGFLDLSIDDDTPPSQQQQQDFSHQWDLPTEYATLSKKNNRSMDFVSVGGFGNEIGQIGQANDDKESELARENDAILASKGGERRRSSHSQESQDRLLGSRKRDSLEYSGSSGKDDEHAHAARPDAQDLSDSEHGDDDDKHGEDVERLIEDKMHSEMEWKSTYFGIGLIGGMWCSSFHCLYALATIEYNAFETYDLTSLDFGILYGSSFLGLSFGLLWSSYLLNKPEWFSRSQDVANISIFFVFLTQCIISFIFLHAYYVLGTFTAVAWFFLVLSRLVLGFGIGFVESSANNLVYEWFADMESPGDIGKAIGIKGRASDPANAENNNAGNNNNNNNNNSNNNDGAATPINGGSPNASQGASYFNRQSSVVAAEDANGGVSYDASDEAAEKTLFLKEFGHISARLICVPLIWLTFSSNENLFWALFIGVLLTGGSWGSMMFAWWKDRRIRTKYEKIMPLEEDDDGLERDTQIQSYQTFDNVPTSAVIAGTGKRDCIEIGDNGRRTSHSSSAVGSAIAGGSVGSDRSRYGSIDGHSRKHSAPKVAVPRQSTSVSNAIAGSSLNRTPRAVGGTTPRIMAGFGIGSTVRTYSDIGNENQERRVTSHRQGAYSSNRSSDGTTGYDIEQGIAGDGQQPQQQQLQDHSVTQTTPDAGAGAGALFFEDMTYKDWYEMDCVGLNGSTILSVVFLSINFGISFAFIILSLNCFVEQYGYTSYTANLLIAAIPLSSIIFSNMLRKWLSKLTSSIFVLMVVGNTLFALCYGLLAFSGVSGSGAWVLPLMVVFVYIFGIECVTSTGYEVLLSTAPEYIHGLVSGVNSTCNFAVTALFCLIFGALVLDDASDVSVKYSYAFTFLFVATLINYGVIGAMKYSMKRLVLPIHSPLASE